MSDSDKFIALQNAYKTKAQHDVDAVMTRIERLLLNMNKPYDYISEHFVKLMCKNAYHLRSIRYRSINQEYDPQSSNMGALMGKNQIFFKRKIKYIFVITLIKDQDPQGDIIFYILLRAVENFFLEYKRYPGANNDIDLDSDMNLFKKILNKLLNDNSVAVNITDEYINEM